MVKKIAICLSVQCPQPIIHGTSLPQLSVQFMRSPMFVFLDTDTPLYLKLHKIIRSSLETFYHSLIVILCVTHAEKARKK